MKKLLLILLCLPMVGFGQNISNKDIKKSEKLFQKGVKYYTKAVNQKEPRYYDFQSNSQKYDSKGNFQKAIECHDSKEYQKGWALAKDTTVRHMQVVEGFSTE